MSIFARREIQTILDSYESIVGKKKLRQIITALNIEGSETNEKRVLESVSRTWEIAIISAFAMCGNIKHESKISNGKCPDIFYRDQDISLLADVFAVSDDQQHKKNPADEFSSIIQKLWRDLGPRKGTLAWRIEAIDLPASTPAPSVLCWPLHLSSRGRPINRGTLKRLALPPSSGLSEYLRKKVSPFFEELQASSNIAKSLQVDEPYDAEIAVRFSITYSPNGTGLSGTYPAYTTISDIERHVLWGRLTDKSKQFALATEEMPRVIFVCDAGCEALSNSLAGVANEYRIEEILDHFWRRPVYSTDQGWSWITENNISAVLVLSIEAVSAPLFLPVHREFSIKARLYTNHYSRYPLNESSTKLLGRIVSKLPKPIESPSNALRAASVNPITSRRLGGFTMSQNAIEISGIELLQILSGELSPEDFCRNYSLSSNPFKNALMAYRTIESVKVEPAVDRDDDKIIIEFGSYDAAIGPFRVLQDVKSRATK